MTRGEMMARMTARELDAWAAYNAQWPIGDRRADIRAGVIASTIANAHRDPKTTSPFVPADFMLFRDDDDGASVEDLSLKFQQAAGYVEPIEDIPDGVNIYGYIDE